MLAFSVDRLKESGHPVSLRKALRKTEQMVLFPQRIENALVATTQHDVFAAPIKNRMWVTGAAAKRRHRVEGAPGQTEQLTRQNQPESSFTCPSAPPELFTPLVLALRPLPSLALFSMTFAISQGFFCWAF